MYNNNCKGYSTTVSGRGFYNRILELLEDGNSRIWFYSVSACLGFFSLGMHVFSNFLTKIDHLTRAVRPEIDIRLLIHFDNNLIDQFAKEQYSQLNKRRIVAREACNIGDNDNMQYIILENKSKGIRMLEATNLIIKERNFFNFAINKIPEDATYYKDHQVAVGRNNKHFLDHWHTSREIICSR